jgi:hypothetical protein
MTANTGTTHLRQKARAPNAPLFWVRLVALSHAGVLTDALSHLPDPQRFLRWSVENFYPDYHWQGLIDRREAPRWNPDWIDPDQLHAEIVGRVNNAMQLMPRDMWPAAWASIMGDAITRLETERRVIAASFAGPFDDFQQTPTPLPPLPALLAAEEKLEQTSYLSDARSSLPSSTLCRHPSALLRVSCASSVGRWMR